MKNKNELRRKILSNFSEIYINPFQILVDPYLSFLCWPLAYFFNCLKGFKRRQDILKKCEEKISKELDVINVVRKLRMSTNFLNNLLGKR
jgi:hypothetical protein